MRISHGISGSIVQKKGKQKMCDLGDFFNSFLTVFFQEQSCISREKRLNACLPILVYSYINQKH